MFGGNNSQISSLGGGGLFNDVPSEGGRDVFRNDIAGGMIDEKDE